MMQKSGDSPATVVAIGDVHGCADLLEQTLAPHLGSGAELIFLGDLIDRSPDRDGDRRVVERVRQLQEQPDAYGLAGVTVLRGNHEQMLLDALHEPDAGDATELWEWNGGDRNFLPAARDHQDWLETLPLTAIRGDYLFVHAGVRP
jgi:serine/threonine protein phosphatase 1